MVTKAVAAAPEAISEESAKTQLADRPTETQAVVDTTHADGTTGGNAPPVAGESPQDAKDISPASDTKISKEAPMAFGKLSSIESLPWPGGQHVKDFDDRQKSIKKAARPAKKAIATGTSPVPPAVAAAKPIMGTIPTAKGARYDHQGHAARSTGLPQG
jgi:hypothetical protein